MDIAQKTIGMLTDELITVDIKCFLIQDAIRDPNLSAEKQLEAAHKAQELNARRNQLMRAIDIRLGEAEFTLTEKTYG